MKKTTEQIYNKITSDLYKSLYANILRLIETKGFSLPNSEEYTIENINEDLQFIIVTLEDVCDNRKIEEYSLATRNSILTQLGDINTHFSNSNSSAGNINHFHHLINAIDNLKQMIINCNLSLKRSNIPAYNQKLKEYEQLNGILKSFLEEITEAKQNTDQLKSWVTSSSGYVKDIKTALNNINILLEEIDKVKDKAESLESEAKRNINNIASDRQDVVEIKSEIVKHKQTVESITNEIDIIMVKMEKSIQDGIDQQVKIEVEWKEYQKGTDSLISKNKELNYKLEQQIQKATGGSLFGVFDKRKEELSKNLYGWLIASGIAIFILLGLSYSIVSDVSKKDFSEWLFFAKLSGSLPLIYLIYFTSNRFTKERRLIEEYAFKSTISFALEPYSKLIEKLKDDSATQQYKDFMIDSIRDIFSTPTDKVFSKEEKVPHDSFLKNIDEMHKIFEKLKNYKT